MFRGKWIVDNQRDFTLKPDPPLAVYFPTFDWLVDTDGNLTLAPDETGFRFLYGFDISKLSLNPEQGWYNDGKKHYSLNIGPKDVNPMLPRIRTLTIDLSRISYPIR